MFFFLFIDLNFLISAAIAEIFNPIAELVIPIRISNEEAKAETEIHPVSVEAKIRNCYDIIQSCKNLFCDFYSSIHFARFFQRNSLLFHLYFLI